MRTRSQARRRRQPQVRQTSVESSNLEKPDNPPIVAMADNQLHQLDTFYNALNSNDQDSLNSAAGGNFLDKMPRECLKIIESKSKCVTTQGPKAVNHDVEVTKDTMHPANNGSTENVQPPVVQVRTLIPNPGANVPTPPHLEYAFLEGDNKFPVIIAKDLKDEEKAALLKVLKSHKRAIAWKLSDIKGVSPEFCTHKILMEEDYEPSVQSPKEGERYIRSYQEYEQYMALCEQEAGGSGSGTGSRSSPKKRAYIPRQRETAEERLIDDYFGDEEIDPKYTEENFRRREGYDCTGRKSIGPILKCTSAIRQLAYGTAADAFDEYLQIEKHGLPGMLGSIDCMHWDWKNCPKALAAQFKRRDHKYPTIMLEAVADQRLWIWHAYFGVPGANNDLNVLYGSPLFDDDLPTEKTLKFKRIQESSRKDIERAFGVLQDEDFVVNLRDVFVDPTPDIPQEWTERCDLHVRKHKELRDSKVHNDLRDDLVEHVWNLIMEYLVKISKKAHILELKRRHLKITEQLSDFVHITFTYLERRLTMEEMLYKFIDEGKREHEEMRAFINEFRTTNKLLFKERNNSLSELRFEVEKQQLKIFKEEPLVVNHNKPVEPKEVLVENQHQKTNEPVVQPSFGVQTPSIPFPRMLRKEKEEAQQKKVLRKFKATAHQFALHRNPCSNAKVRQIMKGLLTNKARLEEACTITMNERYSAVLLNKLPSKEKDPRSFTIPCDIGQLHINNALADLGASISLMSYTMYEKLGLGEPKPTRMSLELADRSIQYPRGIIENVLIKVDKFILPNDFVILDMPEDSRVPIILRRLFWATARAMIDVFNKKITLRVGDDEVIFDVDQSIKRPPNEDDEWLEKSINQSDLESCESLGNKSDDDSDLEKLIRHIDSFNTPYSVAQETTRPDGVESEHLYSASANEIDEKKPELKKLPRH
ncbi:DNA-directed DNA polymerase [Tanacetum coccineum]